MERFVFVRKRTRSHVSHKARINIIHGTTGAGPPRTGRRDRRDDDDDRNATTGRGVRKCVGR